MKIVCEACQAKYSIADEKVRGKVFKIRCKKCSHVIVVRGGGSAEAGSAPSAEFASSPSSAPDLALDAGWHIVVDGEQVGPLSEGDIRARLARGEINPDTYIWKEGLADWVKVSTLPEFRGEGEVPSPFSGPPADDGFGAGAATMVSNSPGADVFAGGSAASAGGVGADLFGSPVAAEAGGGRAATGAGQLGYGGYDSPAAPDPFAPMGGGNGASGGGVGAGMTGQRHENSVLFSLSNLEALAKPSTAAPLPAARSPGAASPSTSTTTEGSGLIDIRAMANMTLGAAAAKADSRGPDLPAFSAPQFSPVAPVLLSPGHGGGMPRWAIVSLLAGVGVLAIFLAVVAVKLLTAPPPAPVVTTPPPAAAPPATAKAPPPAQAPPTTPPPAANEDLPPREPARPAGATADRDDRRTGKPGASGTRRPGSRPGGDGDRAPGAVTPTPRTAAEAPAPAPRKPKDDIEALLEQATGNKRSGGGSPAPAARREEEEPKPSERLPPLGREEVVKGMNSIIPRARDCYNQYKQQGLAMVKLTVAPSGRVTAATVTGKFAGTPTGTCVENAVKSGKFAPSAGLTFDYPVPLR